MCIDNRELAHVVVNLKGVRAFFQFCPRNSCRKGKKKPGVFTITGSRDTRAERKLRARCANPCHTGYIGYRLSDILVFIVVVVVVSRQFGFLLPGSDEKRLAHSMK